MSHEIDCFPEIGGGISFFLFFLECSQKSREEHGENRINRSFWFFFSDQKNHSWEFFFATQTWPTSGCSILKKGNIWEIYLFDLWLQSSQMWSSVHKYIYLNERMFSLSVQCWTLFAGDTWRNTTLLQYYTSYQYLYGYNIYNRTIFCQPVLTSHLWIVSLIYYLSRNSFKKC